jgi:hypothetical protein
MEESMQRLNVPIGVSDFKTLRESNRYYIDKTGFIREVLESAPQVLLFPRPRRFGKSLNLSMLRYFLERSWEDRTPLFEGLAVMRDEMCRKHFQRYPVIHARLADLWDPKGKGPLATLRVEVRQIYKAHRYLLAEGILERDESARFQQILRGRADEATLCSALLDLSQFLHRLYRQRVVILVDEYDAPLNTSYQQHTYTETVRLIRQFLTSGLKDNPHLFKGVLTGVLRVAKESIFSGLNNLSMYSILRPEFATWFGFTEEEAQALLQAAEIPELLDQARAWYQGYLFGGHSIYNPWSLLQFVDQKDSRLRSYWAKSSTEDIPAELAVQWGILYHDDFKRLVRNKTIKKPIEERVALRELHEHPEAVWSIMAMAGYLRAEPTEKNHRGAPLCKLSFPNREVMETFPDIFKQWMTTGLGVRWLVELELSLIEGNDKRVVDLLEDLLLMPSYHDLDSKKPEAHYHAFVTALISLLYGRFDIRSNRESGYGRYDVMMLPKRAGQPGVVLEIKALKTRNSAAPGEVHVERALEAALSQIREGFYTYELRERGANPIREVAMVFHGKRLWVRSRLGSQEKPPVRQPKRARRPPDR